MPTTVPVIAAPAAGKPLERSTVERRDAGPHDIVIDVKFCGICHSDIHQARDEWGPGIYPMVPGHEIAGVVAEVGAEVSSYSVGDHVGVGCFVDSCRECENCKAGEEQYCLKGEVPTYNGKDYEGSATYGGYSKSVVVDENYVLRIPESIELKDAAPLLCAGITLFSPLHHWEAGPGKRVGIIGMGGLGHMGVQIAAAMGAETIGLSRTTSKEEDAEKLGANAYYATQDDQTFKELKGTFDLIINTVSAKIDLDKHLGLLKLNGAMVNVGIPDEPVDLQVFSLAGMRRSLAASKIGGIRETQEMLDFCAEHNLKAWVEVIGADDVNEAYERVMDSDVRYRFVIDTATLED